MAQTDNPVVLLEGTQVDAWRPVPETLVNRADGATTFTAQRAYTDGTLARNKIIGDLDGSGREEWVAPKDVDIITTQSLLRQDPATYTTVQEYVNATTSAGWLDGGLVTDNGDGTVNVAPGSGLFRSASTHLAPLYLSDWAAATVSPAENQLLHVGVGWTGPPALPLVESRLTDNWDHQTEFPLAVVQRLTGTDMQIVRHRHVIADGPGLTALRFHELIHVGRDEAGGGLIIAETGARNITVSAGALWIGLVRNAIPAFDTSGSDTFRRFYRDGVGGWTEQATETQWDNEQYDDGSGTLASIPGNNYSQQWFYIGFDGELYSIYGTDVDPQSAVIEAIGPPSDVAPRVENHAILIGRVIFRKNDATATEVQSAFDTVFQPIQATDHGNLAGLADDDHPHYLLQDGTEPMLGDWFAGNIRISADALTLGAAGTGEITVPGAGAGGPEQFGENADASGEDSTVVGANTTATGAGATIVGQGSSAPAGMDDAHLFGIGITATADRQFIVGGPDRYVESMFIGRGPTHATPPSFVTWGTTGGSGIDINGSDLRIESGRGTGAGTGGRIEFRIAQAGLAGLPVLNPTVEVLSIVGRSVTHSIGAGVGNFDIGPGNWTYTGATNSTVGTGRLRLGATPDFGSSSGDFQAGDADRKFVVNDVNNLFGTVTAAGLPDTVFAWGDGNQNLVNFNKDNVNTLVYGDGAVNTSEMILFDADEYRTEQVSPWNLRGETLTISAGAVSANRSCIAVRPETGTSDDLDTISLAAGAQEDGDVMVVKVQGTLNTITVKHATGNLRLNGSADKTLNSVFDRLVLQWEAESGGAWCQIGFSDNG